MKTTSKFVLLAIFMSLLIYGVLKKENSTSQCVIIRETATLKSSLGGKNVMDSSSQFNINGETTTLKSSLSRKNVGVRDLTSRYVINGETTTLKSSLGGENVVMMDSSSQFNINGETTTLKSSFSRKNVGVRDLTSRYVINGETTMFASVLSRKNIITLDPSTRISSNTSNTKYLIDTPVCKIPDYDPFDKSVKKLIGRASYVKCNKFRSFTYEKNGKIYINWQAVNASKFKDKLKYCKMRPVIRPVNSTSDHNSRAYLKESAPFVEYIEPRHEHIHIRCFNGMDKFLFHGFHIIILQKEDVEKRCTKIRQDIMNKNPDTPKPISVSVIVLDSISRLNSLRFLTKTRNFILEKMGAEEMMGYSKVGYGTFHNLIPAFTGKFYEELPYDYRKPIYFDNFTFLWNYFEENGFRTYIDFDIPLTALFDYHRKGFHKTPTDYYHRAMSLTMFDQKEILYKKDECVHDRHQTQWVYEPFRNFSKLFSNNPYFAITHYSKLTHDKIERTAHADDIFYDFFKQAHRDGTLENTLTVLMADHGMRFGPIRSSYIGYMEERLPMLFIIPPKSFLKKYPTHMANLRKNARRLTTHFDVHETLKDIAAFDGKLKVNDVKKRAMNLFSEIPEGRTCKDACIAPPWCPCIERQKVDTKGNSLQNVARFLVKNINQRLSNFSDVCANLTLDEFINIRRLHKSETDKEKYIIVYSLMVRTKPGAGLFESTVSYNTRTKTLSMGQKSEDIERLNAYRFERQCNVNHKERHLCYCKTNIQE